MKNPSLKKRKAPTVGAVGGLGKNRTLSQSSLKSTAKEAQRERIIEALKLRPQTSYDLRRLGIYQAPARIKELRDKFGFSITTSLVTVVDRDGYLHPRCALYTLNSDPGQARGRNG